MLKDFLFYLAFVLVLITAVFSFMNGWYTEDTDDDEDMQEFQNKITMLLERSKNYDVMQNL